MIELPELYIVISQREYKRLYKHFTGEEPPKKGFQPQIWVRGVPLFTNEAIRGIKKFQKEAKK